MNPSVAHKAMIVRLSISQWTARKYDKRISEHVAREFGATADAGRYNKLLIAEEAIDTVSQLVTRIRDFNYDNTLPWKDDGSRILLASNFGNYSARMRAFRAEYEAAVNALCDNYPALVEEARDRLNGLWRESDYPHLSEVRARYGFALDIDPLPTAGDFRVSLSDEEVSAVRAEIEARFADRQAAAMADVWKRVHKVVKHAAETLQNPKAIFRDTLVQNARELVELLPYLNLTADPALESIRGEIARSLCEADPQTLRKDKEERQTMADACAGILETMGAFMGASA